MNEKSPLVSLSDDGSLTLYPSILSRIGVLAVCSAFVALGIWLGITQGAIWYLAAAFFAIGIPIAMIQLLPSSSYLRISSDELTFCNMFRETKMPWNILDSFETIVLKQNESTIRKMVGIHFTSDYAKSPTMRKLNNAISGVDGALPDTYGMKAEELTALLNECLHNFKTPK